MLNVIAQAAANAITSAAAMLNMIMQAVVNIIISVAVLPLSRTGYLLMCGWNV
jgi:hypothetical protein